MPNTVGPATTLTDDVPVATPEFAKIVVLPGATALTTPVELIVATDVWLDCQLTGHPPAGGVPTVPSSAVIAS